MDLLLIHHTGDRGILMHGRTYRLTSLKALTAWQSTNKLEILWMKSGEKRRTLGRLKPVVFLTGKFTISTGELVAGFLVAISTSGKSTESSFQLQIARFRGSKKNQLGKKGIKFMYLDLPKSAKWF